MVIARGRPTVPENDQAAGTREVREAETAVPRLLGNHLLGVARLAVIALDAHARVAHWSGTAEDLFGVVGCQAVGRSLRTLLRLPQEHRAVFEPDEFAQVWSGAFAVPRADNGELAEIAWWVYPFGPLSGAEIRVLAVAADLRRLSAEGPGLCLGDTLVVPPAAGATAAGSGIRMLRIEPALVPPAGRDAARLGRGLAGLLTSAGHTGAEALTAGVLSMGYPAVNLSVTIRLPIVPYWGGMPRALRIRPRAAEPARRVRANAAASPRPRPTHELETMAVRERFTFLGEAGQQIGSSLDHLQASRTLAEVLVPQLADFASVVLLERVATADWEPASREVDGSALMRRVAVVHDDEPGRWDDTLPEGEALFMPDETPFVEAMRTGRAVHLPRISRENAEAISAPFTDRDLRPLITGRALLVVPLVARGQVLGTFKLMRKAGRPGFDDLDLAVVDELARRAALCIDNGRLYRREVQMVQELQRSMLPAEAPTVAGARVRYRYRPAGQAAQVGGDWFDTIPLPGCRVAIVIGDVMGHGVTSAAIMGQLRTAVRTLAAQDLRPDQLLRHLDDLAQRLGEDYVATCLYAVYDPVDRRCQVANAGHLPPVLVSPYGEAAVARVPTGVPIGVGGEPFETVEFPVEDGSRLILCTDGLIERRDRDVAEGLEVLREHLDGMSHSLDGTCDALLGALAPASPADDVALVAVGCDGIPKDDVVSWDLEAEASMVPRARAEVTARLAHWGLGELADVVELLVSELVTNALVHGAGAIGMRLVKGGTLLCEVSDDGHELPYVCDADATDESGRGLQLVSHLADRWGTRRTDFGKVVWFEHALA
ncbi:SpoIIE family protein phosphatase [Spirillospora sp. NPDC047279]|uniref:ATP-binding SpoIIE family protein phosphatase n=1 Tax=Spirillospora sp. NPDC047279 TaxID=3155478 RepID=UPI0033EAED67